jgi:hypothetical protein
MNNQSKTPQEIVALIEYAEEQSVLMAQKLEQKKIEEEQQNELRNREVAQRLFDDAIEMIPDVIRPFVKLDGVDISDQSHYGMTWNDLILEFHIPELAPIAMVFDVDRQTDKPKLTKWIVSGIGETDYDSDLEVCKTAVFKFGDRYQKVVKDKEINLYEVLQYANNVAKQLPEFQQSLDLSLFRLIKRQRENEALEEKQRSGEQALFDAIKNDGIAIHLLKAFVLLRDERSNFEQRLNEADESLYWIDERWSRQAADLRRQAEDADRRAADEKAQLQNVLDDVESKLKKAIRG